MNETEIKKVPAKQTKEERNKNIIILIGCVCLFAEFLIIYPLPDAEFLGFARNIGFTLSGVFTLFIGMLLAETFSGRKYTIPKNLGFVIVGSILIAVIAVLICLVFEVFDYSEITNPADYLPLILKYSAVMFPAGVLIRVLTLYADDLIEKYLSKKMKF